MLRVISCVLLILVSANSFCATAAVAQSRVASPIVVLEVTTTNSGIGGYHDKHMLVRLTDDGKVEWDRPVGPQAWERLTSSVSAELVYDIERTLKAIDESLIRRKMGPYYVYVDTSVELQVQMTARQGEVTFLVMNPWSSRLVKKAMPKDVKTVVCEISMLQARVANTPIDRMCKSSDKAQ
jgi:hypothetical protein